MLARRTEILINGRADLNQYVKSFKYSDTIKNEGDTCEITLADVDKSFLNGAANLKGVSFDLALKRENQIWRIGNFEVDKVTNKFPPSECTLALNSVPQSAGRGEDKHKSWEQTNLSAVASDIAAQCGLSLFYDAEDFEIKRLEQSGEPDLKFLKRICQNYGLSVKVHDKKLIVFSEERYESKAAVQSISSDDARLINFSATASATDIHGGAEVSFSSNNISEWLFGFFGGNLFKGSFGGGSGSGNLNIVEKVNNQSEAETLAKSNLREKNKNEWTANLTLVGDFNFVAGINIELVKFGLHSGKYILERVDHNLNEQGYTVKINCRKCLSY